MRYADIAMFLDLADKNIRRLKLSGAGSPCYLSALEKKQSQLHNAFYKHSSNTAGGNLGFIPALVVIGAGYLASLGAAIWWHYQSTEKAIAEQETYKSAIERGLDPSQFKPACSSPVDSIISVVKIGILLGAVAMAYQIFTKFKK